MTDRIRAPSFVIEMDQCELAVRLAEACMGVRRAGGQSATDALKQLAEMDQETAAGFARAAARAMEYFRECAERGQRPS